MRDRFAVRDRLVAVLGVPKPVPLLGCMCACALGLFGMMPALAPAAARVVAPSGYQWGLQLSGDGATALISDGLDIFLIDVKTRRRRFVGGSNIHTGMLSRDGKVVVYTESGPDLIVYDRRRRRSRRTIIPGYSARAITPNARHALVVRDSESRAALTDLGVLNLRTRRFTPLPRPPSDSLSCARGAVSFGAMSATRRVVSFMFVCSIDWKANVVVERASGRYRFFSHDSFPTSSISDDGSRVLIANRGGYYSVFDPFRLSAIEIPRIASTGAGLTGDGRVSAIPCGKQVVGLRTVDGAWSELSAPGASAAVISASGNAVLYAEDETDGPIRWISTADARSTGTEPPADCQVRSRPSEVGLRAPAGATSCRRTASNEGSGCSRRGEVR